MEQLGWIVTGGLLAFLAAMLGIKYAGLRHRESMVADTTGKADELTRFAKAIAYKCSNESRRLSQHSNTDATDFAKELLSCAKRAQSIYEELIEKRHSLPMQSLAKLETELFDFDRKIQRAESQHNFDWE